MRLSGESLTKPRLASAFHPLGTWACELAMEPGTSGGVITTRVQKEHFHFDVVMSIKNCVTTTEFQQLLYMGNLVPTVIRKYIIQCTHQ